VIVASAGQGLVAGTLLARDNRFLARVRVGGREALAHVPNPGRMTELMIPGRTVHLRPAPGGTRKTAWDLLAIDHDGLWVCLDNRFGGRLAGLALAAHAIDGLPPYRAVRAEVKSGHSRLDYYLDAEPPTWLEVKSCTLVVDGRGLFPDAPTVRGTRHLTELTELARTCGAAVLFVIQRPDAVSLAPHDATDPAFGAALRNAEAAGVRLLARRCVWSTEGLRLAEAVPVLTA
jgi:sugar fermentation stimulation protein A